MYRKELERGRDQFGRLSYLEKLSSVSRVQSKYNRNCCFNLIPQLCCPWGGQFVTLYKFSVCMKTYPETTPQALKTSDAFLAAVGDWLLPFGRWYYAPTLSKRMFYYKNRNSSKSLFTKEMYFHYQRHFGFTHCIALPHKNIPSLQHRFFLGNCV